MTPGSTTGSPTRSTARPAGVVPCAVLGPGNIGTDLMAKLQRSDVLQLTAMVGIDPESPGLARAREAGLDASAEGIDWILAHADQCQVVFDATSAGAHRANGPRLLDAGIRCLDLTPAKMGPGVVPVVNLDRHIDAPEVNLITCAGQATIPMVHAVTQVTDVPYAEIVATVASVSAGPGTRQSIDEFTRTTAKGLAELGGAGKGKAIIVLNPAEPPIIMRNTVYCALPGDVDADAIRRSIEKYAAEVQAYVPGYRLRTEPVFDAPSVPGGWGRVAIFVEVESAGDFLPAYAGNLDIMTAAAVRVAEEFARNRLSEETFA
jgi:acetaldehyde dehydrogenase